MHDFLTDTSPQTSNSQATPAIKAVAGYEIVKGLGVLAIAFAVLIWHDRLPNIVAYLIRILHHIFGRFFCAVAG